MPSRTFSSNEDPLDVVLRPPPDETPQARAERLHKEAEAKKVSDAIDESIRQEKVAWKKNKTLLRLLLLGQSESGEYRFMMLFLHAAAMSAALWPSPTRPPRSPPLYNGCFTAAQRWLYHALALSTAHSRPGRRYSARFVQAAMQSPRESSSWLCRQ